MLKPAQGQCPLSGTPPRLDGTETQQMLKVVNILPYFIDQEVKWEDAILTLSLRHRSIPILLQKMRVFILSVIFENKQNRLTMSSDCATLNMGNAVWQNA